MVFTSSAFFLRARAVINFVMRALQKSQMTVSEHFVNFPPAGISHYENVVLLQVIWP